MHYKISVPILSGAFEKYGKENTVKMLKEMKADRVFYSLDKYLLDKESQKNIFIQSYVKLKKILRMMKILKTNKS